MKRSTLALVVVALVSCDGATGPEPLEQGVPSSVSAPPQPPPPPPPTACPGYAVPSKCPPFPTGGTNVISGRVFERTADGERPVVYGALYAWVQTPTYGYSAGRVITDASGSYQRTLLPNALIVMQAFGAYDQPCAAIVQLNSPTATADIEVVSKDTPRFDPSPPSPSITGTVYDSASGQPLAGVWVGVESTSEIIFATTTTDSEGRFSLCRTPQGRNLVFAYLLGYAVEYTEVMLEGDSKVDIVLRK